MRVLLWRSPNQVGEYVLLEPTPGSFLPEWHSSSDLPQADSRVLRLWQLTNNMSVDELITWTRANRYVRELTCPEREQYRVEPYCD